MSTPDTIANPVVDYQAPSTQAGVRSGKMPAPSGFAPTGEASLSGPPRSALPAHHLAALYRTGQI